MSGMEDIWLQPCDSTNTNINIQLKLFQAILSAFTYLYGYTVIYISKDYFGYPSMLKKYLTITLKIEPIVFCLISCSASIVLTIFGHAAFTHSLSILSLLKQTAMTILYSVISLLGLAILILLPIIESKPLNGLYSIYIYVFLSWLIAALKAFKYIPNISRLFTSAIDFFIYRHLDNEKYEPFNDDYIDSIPMKNADSYYKSFGSLINKEPN